MMQRDLSSLGYSISAVLRIFGVESEVKLPSLMALFPGWQPDTPGYVLNIIDVPAALGLCSRETLTEVLLTWDPGHDLVAGPGKVELVQLLSHIKGSSPGSTQNISLQHVDPLVSACLEHWRNHMHHNRLDLSKRSRVGFYKSILDDQMPGNEEARKEAESLQHAENCMTGVLERYSKLDKVWTDRIDALKHLQQHIMQVAREEVEVVETWREIALDNLQKAYTLFLKKAEIEK